MKNKLLKTLACFASVFTIGSTIAITSTSCGCSNKESIRALPNEVYDIDETTHELKGFTSEFLDNPSAYSEYDTMEIPTIVTSVVDSAFIILDPAQCITYTTIPSFIKNLTFAKNSNCSSIGNSAFAMCSSLISVAFPDGLTTIVEQAFIECPSLTSILFPSSLITIGGSAFWFCSALNSVTFPSSLESIGDGAFGYCSLLSSITFPKNNSGKYGLATNLGDNAQVVVEKDNDGNYKWTDTNLVVGSLVCGDVIIPDGTTSISIYAFSECSALASVSLPSNLTVIGQDAFSSCQSLTEIIWNNLNSAPTIGLWAFDNVANKGYVKSTGSYTSSQLLSLLKQKGGLPSDWEVSND